MPLKFIIGVFAGLILLSLIIVWAIRGNDLLFFSKASPTPAASSLPLPVIDNNTNINQNTNPSPAPGAANPSASPRPVVNLGKTYASADLGLTFSYPARFSLIALKRGVTTEYPYLTYDFIFTTNKQLNQTQDASGFEVYVVPHPENRSLESIINEQSSRLSRRATFATVTPAGNSLSTVRFSGGTAALYALRTPGAVYYVSDLNYKNVAPDGSDDVTASLDQIIPTFQFAQGR